MFRASLKGNVLGGLAVSGVGRFRLLRWGAVLLPLAIAGVWAALSWPQATREAYAEAEVSASLIQQYVSRVLQSQENLISHLTSLINDTDLSEVDRDAANAYLQQLVSSFEYTKFVAIVSPTGDLLFTGGEGFEILDQDHARLLAMIDSAAVGIQVDRWTDAAGEDVLVIYSGEGRLVAAVDVNVMVEFMAATTTISGSAAALSRLDGRIVMRYSSLGGLSPAMDVEPTSPAFQAFARADSGRFEAVSRVDDEPRLFGFARVGELPLYATFGFPRAFVVAGWLGDVAPVAALLALASALALFGIQQSARGIVLEQQRQRLEFDRHAFADAERRAREHEVLLKDLHHRTKNNLQAIQSLIALRLSGSMVEREAFDAIRQRVWAIAEVHDLLYSSESLKSLKLADFLRAACRNAALIPPERHIAVTCEAVDVDIDIHQAVPVALTVVELITNAVKHAFAGVADKRLLVLLHRNGDRLELTISDNGIGLPEDRPMASGLRVANALLVQFGGEMETTVQHGTTYRITFPIDPPSAVPLLGSPLQASA